MKIGSKVKISIKPVVKKVKIKFLYEICILMFLRSSFFTKKNVKKIVKKKVKTKIVGGYDGKIRIIIKLDIVIILKIILEGEEKTFLKLKIVNKKHTIPIKELIIKNEW